MHNLASVWLAGCLATAATAASTVFNGILAVNNTSNDRLTETLRILLFVSLGFSFLGTLSLLYFTAFYVRNVKSQSLQSRNAVWGMYAFGVVVGLASLALPAVPLVWLTIDQVNLSDRILGQEPVVWLAIWYGCWGLAIFAQLNLFVILALWARQHLQTQSVCRLDIDSGTRLPPTPRDTMIENRNSYHSRDTTIAEDPRTPSTQRPGSSRPGSSSQYSASIKMPTGSARTRPIGPPRSAHSSIDMPFPAGEARPLDNAFDRWDTSTVHSEMRAAVGSSPIARTGLETIPGSRPESPEDALDEPSLPSSPQVRSSSPQAITSDTATALGDWSSSPARYIPTSSPPSSPPNFSRPTSKHKNQPLITAVTVPVQDKIHPLFRSSSPHPPPIATWSTTITASPMADQPITPRTLANLRSHNKSSSGVNLQPIKPTGHWRAMPSVSQTSERRPSTAGSQGPGSPPPGSPGPSVVDEEELPPILPGFVLSAGQRSSMLGYASRKSVKSRRESQMSTGM